MDHRTITYRKASGLARFRALAVMCCALLGADVAAQVTGPAPAATPAPPKAESRNLAPGFKALPEGAKLVVMPVDIELYSISGGGVLEPRADWTRAATGHFMTALMQKQDRLGLKSIRVSDADADEFEELNNLHGAVANAIAMHHFGPLALPTKAGQLDWALGEATLPIKAKTGAQYALFTWFRDSYASDERKAAMIALAMFGIGVTGGFQVGYASLVDLDTGRVVWFNHLVRSTGDLREAVPAQDTLEALLKDFPVPQ